MIVLDTHVWVWWVTEAPKLSARARRSIQEAEAIGICAMSCWEVARLVQKGRLKLDREVLAWIHQALALPRLTLLPITPEIAVRAAALPPSFPGDPGDRLILATAMQHGAALVSKDRLIRADRQANVIW